MDRSRREVSLDYKDYVFGGGFSTAILTAGISMAIAAWYAGPWSGLCVAVGCGMAGFSIGSVIGWIVYKIRGG